MNAPCLICKKPFEGVGAPAEPVTTWWGVRPTHSCCLPCWEEYAAEDRVRFGGSSEHIQEEAQEEQEALTSTNPELLAKLAKEYPLEVAGNPCAPLDTILGLAAFERGNVYADFLLARVILNNTSFCTLWLTVAPGACKLLWAACSAAFERRNTQLRVTGEEGELPPVEYVILGARALLAEGLAWVGNQKKSSVP